MYHTIPVVFHAWLRNQNDFRAAILDLVRCGGDTDTTAAILGGIAGAQGGAAGIPGDWLDGLWEWPRSPRWMGKLGERLAEAAADQIPRPALPLAVWGLLPRNLFFLAIVLAHGFRRLLPPY
jgi:ADP-ribosyl-[dinitrogen reductase] hydrolase